MMVSPSMIMVTMRLGPKLGAKTWPQEMKGRLRRPAAVSEIASPAFCGQFVFDPKHDLALLEQPPGARAGKLAQTA
jgi:hypothetical protein